MSANSITVIATGKKRFVQPEIVMADLYPEPQLKDFDEIILIGSGKGVASVKTINQALLLTLTYKKGNNVKPSLH